MLVFSEATDCAHLSLIEASCSFATLLNWGAVACSMSKLAEATPSAPTSDPIGHPASTLPLCLPFAKSVIAG
eukprot:1160300-Pelagomonas_calceolata.AAC.16